MGTNEVILLQAQAAIEAVRGTGLPATRKLYSQVTGNYTRTLMEFQDTSGTYFPRRRPAYGRASTTFSFSDILTFEDGPWWSQFFAKGGVTGVAGTGTPLPYTYTFVPTLAADDLKSMTLEFNEVGNPYEAHQVMISTANLRMDSDNDNEAGWMIDLEGMGIDWTTSTFTPALADRTTEVVLARGTKVFIDEPGGTIGTTQLTGSLISCSATFQTGIVFKAFSEDISGFAPNKVGRQAYVTDAQFTFEFDDDVEFAKYRTAGAPVQRIIRLERSGSEINVTGPTNKLFQLDLYGYWNSWSRGDREGNLTATMGLAAFHDATAAKSYSLKFVNSLPTLP